MVQKAAQSTGSCLAGRLPRGRIVRDRKLPIRYVRVELEVAPSPGIFVRRGRLGESLIRLVCVLVSAFVYLGVSDLFRCPCGDLATLWFSGLVASFPGLSIQIIGGRTEPRLLYMRDFCAGASLGSEVS